MFLEIKFYEAAVKQDVLEIRFYEAVVKQNVFGN